MKKTFSILTLAFSALIATSLVSSCASQRAAGIGSVNADSLVQSGSFVFIPRTVIPTGARSRQVNADFFLRIGRDTVQSYLPYFGRAFTAPTPGSRGVMDFTITDFDYSVSQGSRNEQVITIRPRTGTDVQELTVEVFENGSATVRAQSNNRQPISYNGIAQPRIR